MSILRRVTESLTGDVHLYITVGEGHAAEIRLDGNVILVEVKNPLLAAVALLKQLRSNQKGSALGGKSALKKLKKLGYTVRVKYKVIDVEL